MRRSGIGIAMALFAAVALFGILARPLLPVDETRYLAVAWEMRLTGDWLVPHLNGVAYSHKPPLLFWLINLVWSVFGVSETAARLVGPLFGTAAVGVTGLLARRLWPDEPGIGGRAALALAGFGVFALYAGLTMFDAMLTLAVLLGVFALVRGGDRAWGWVGFGAALAFGALAKGPVILVHLLPVALLTPFWAGIRFGAMPRGLGLALLVGCGLVGLWLVPAIRAGGADYRDAVLVTQSAGRIAGSFGHSQPWWYFVVLLPLLLWPWAWSADLWRRVIRLDRHDRGVRLCAVWAGSALLLFSLMSGKLPHYLLPALPAAALLIARAIGGTPVRAPLASLVPGLVGLSFLAMSLGLIPGDGVAILGQPGWAMAVVGALLLGLAGVTLAARGAGVAFLGPGLAATCALVFAIGAPGEIYDAAPIARLIAPHDAAGIALLGEDYHGEFSFAGRLRRPVVEIADPPAALAWLARTPEAVLLARLDKPHPAAPPRERVLYRNRPYGIWTDPPQAGPTRDPSS